MIFVTLGTQDKQFSRLLEAVQKQIEKGNIKEKVVVQAGLTKFESKDMKIYDLISQEDFEKYVKDCNLLITHGGVGNIFTGLNLGKKVIVVPRLAKYGEHHNDHQLQIADKFCEEGYILKVDDVDDLDKIIRQSEKFTPRKYKSNNKYFCKCLKEQLDKL